MNIGILARASTTLVHVSLLVLCFFIIRSVPARTAQQMSVGWYRYVHYTFYLLCHQTEQLSIDTKIDTIIKYTCRLQNCVGSKIRDLNHYVIRLKEVIGNKQSYTYHLFWNTSSNAHFQNKAYLH